MPRSQALNPTAGDDSAAGLPDLDSMVPMSPDWRALAPAQHGIVARRQLTALGLGWDRVDSQVAADRWTALTPRVVVTFTGTPTWEQRVWAAVLKPLRRSRLFRTALNEIGGGAQSLAELDVARICRRLGLPKPRPQTLRRDGAGRKRFTDCEWELTDGRLLVLEVDGGRATHRSGALAAG